MTNVFYKNRGSKTTRNKDITAGLFSSISHAIYLVYGPEHQAHIYSGGQDRRGKGARRVGTVRHDDYGAGGRAADIYVYNETGDRLTGKQLAPLVQYWLASKIGGVGVEMGRGGVHVDEWANPPSSKAGMFWYYKGTNRNDYTQAVTDGRNGILPLLYQPPIQTPLTRLFSAIASIFRSNK